MHTNRKHIVMRRSELLDLTETTNTAFNALAGRHLLPFLGRRPKGEWASYTEEDALRLVIMKKLTKAGMHQSHAAALVREHFPALERLAESREKKPTGAYYFGAAAYPSEGGGDDVFVPLIAPSKGLDAAIAATSTAIGSGAHASWLVLVNVTECALDLFLRSRSGDRECREWARFFGAKV